MIANTKTGGEKYSSDQAGTGSPHDVSADNKKCDHDTNKSDLDAEKDQKKGRKPGLY